MADKNGKETAKRLLTEYLERNGHRKTPERYAILDTIYTIEGHFSMDTLYETMQNQAEFRVSKATLYNTIVLLVDANLVIRHAFGTPAQYEKTMGRTAHQHLVCTQCGQVSELHDEALHEAVEHTRTGRFQPSHYSLYIYGLCRKCAGTKKKKKTNQ